MTPQQTAKKIKVLLVDDSPIVISILKRVFALSPEIEIVGTAKNGLEGLQLAQQLNPDVVCTDLHMPEMNGLDFTRKLMETNPKPVLVLSSAVQKEDTDNVFNAMKAGAVDVFPKPKGIVTNLEQIGGELIKKIKILRGVTVFRKSGDGRSFSKETANIPFSNTYKMLAIGSSTGGPPALFEILSKFPANFPLPIVCIQHISEGFLTGLVQWLDDSVPLKVTIAKQNEMPAPGNVYFSEEDKHLVIDSHGRFQFSTDAPYKSHRPAVNVTFEAFGRFYNKELLAILLTGMGDDGATGLKVIKDREGFTIAQDEKTCVVFGMPRVAIELNAAREVLSLDHIASRVKQLVGFF
jgi:two-component system, chemotaxis family, protein-glutamate methylesterase/glutaminase